MAGITSGYDILSGFFFGTLNVYYVLNCKYVQLGKSLMLASTKQVKVLRISAGNRTPSPISEIMLTKRALESSEAAC